MKTIDILSESGFPIYRVIEGPPSLQGSPEWHAFRKGKIGASMASAIMGSSPWQTREKLLQEILTGKTRAPTKAMRRGSSLEADAREWLNLKLHTKYSPVVIQSLQYESLIASLDGYYEDEKGVHIAEIKCPGIDSHLEAVLGDIPEHYYPQLQHQMMIADIDEMIYVSFDGTDGVIVPCKRDHKYCERLFMEELKFLTEMNEKL